MAQRLMESPFIVSIYESRLWRRNPVVAAFFGISFDRELECIARAARIDVASRVLDLACGSGIYTRPFARRIAAGRIVGVDISRPMLTYAQRTARAASLSNLDLVRGSALALPFRDATFDVVNCCGALHLFPDVPQALGEIHRVLHSGGRFTTAVVRVADTPVGQRSAQSRLRRLGVYSFTRGEIQRMLGAAGFGRIDVLHEGRIWMIAAGAKAPKED